MKPLPTLRQLRYLVAVVDRCHFGQAADACLVSQSTLSAGIQELEDLLGTPLLERTRRTVMPTPLGREIAERARSLLKDAEDSGGHHPRRRRSDGRPAASGGDSHHRPLPDSPRHARSAHELPQSQALSARGSNRPPARPAEQRGVGRRPARPALPDGRHRNAGHRRGSFLLRLPARTSSVRLGHRAPHRRGDGGFCCCWKTGIACAITRWPPARWTAPRATPCSRAPACTRWCRWSPTGWG